MLSTESCGLDRLWNPDGGRLFPEDPNPQEEDPASFTVFYIADWQRMRKGMTMAEIDEVGAGELIVVENFFEELKAKVGN